MSVDMRPIGHNSRHKIKDTGNNIGLCDRRRDDYVSQIRLLPVIHASKHATLWANATQDAAKKQGVLEIFSGKSRTFPTLAAQCAASGPQKSVYAPSEPVGRGGRICCCSTLTVGGSSDS